MYSGCKWLFQIRRVQPACGFPQTAALAIPRLQGTPTTSTYPAPLRTLSRVHSCIQNCPSDLLFDLVTRNIISPTSTRLGIRYRKNTLAREIDIRWLLFIKSRNWSSAGFQNISTERARFLFTNNRHFAPRVSCTRMRRSTLILLKMIKREDIKD